MTDRFGIIACSKSKRGEDEPDREFPARELYDSWLFDGRVDAVEAHCDQWAIMSAKHGYVDPDDRISWYDQRIDELPWAERVELAREVVDELPPVDEVMVLMGRDYFEPLFEVLPADVEVWDPLEGVRLFDQRSELRDLASNHEQTTLVADGGEVTESAERSTKRRLVRPCRACGRIRHVDDDGHCDDCAEAEQRLLTDGGHGSDELTSLKPRTAFDMWIDRLESERSDATIQSYFYRTRAFIEWLESEGIDNLNDLTGRDLYRFDSFKRSQDLAVSTLKTQFGTIRIFLAFCEDIEAVPRGFSAKMSVPTLAKKDRTNEEKLTAKRAKVIREGLNRYRRASRDHVLFVVAWETGCRLGALRSLDLTDCYLTEDDLERLRHRDDVDEDVLKTIDVPFIHFRHRPDTDTQLKNRQEGERPVNLSDETGELLQEYIEVNRVPKKDKFGRKPLFSTHKGQGRMTTGAIRARFNIMTQPCRYGTCPHNRDEATCEALEHGKESRCPSSRSPHRIRTGSITHHRDCGWPPEVLSEKVNATPEVIRDHYDHPDQLKRMQSRRSYLDNLDEEEADE